MSASFLPGAWSFGNWGWLQVHDQEKLELCPQRKGTPKSEAGTTFNKPATGTRTVSFSKQLSFAFSKQLSWVLGITRVLQPSTWFLKLPQRHLMNGQQIVTYMCGCELGTCYCAILLTSFPSLSIIFLRLIHKASVLCSFL